jgi:predicted HicB family RNase H-like nuclease
MRKPAAAERSKPMRQPVQTSVRLPDDVHRWLTIKARDERTSIQAIVVTLLMREMQRAAAQ